MRPSAGSRLRQQAEIFPVLTSTMYSLCRINSTRSSFARSKNQRAIPQRRGSIGRRWCLLTWWRAPMTPSFRRAK